MWRSRVTGFAALATLCVAAAACGGGGGTTHSTASGPALSDSQATAIGDADLLVFSSANASHYIVGHPQSVRQAEALLKPLTVATTLQVKPSDQVAGGLVTSLLDQLDNVTPGLTTGTGSAERLDAQAVHRLLVFGLKHPAEVFRPRAAAGVNRLEQLMRGMKAHTQVSLAGQVPSVTARQLLAREVQTAALYWPDLAARLRSLEGSLT
jgi:hypothetical protein